MAISTRTAQPVAPTAILPPLSRLSSYSTERIEQALANLRNIYASYSIPTRRTPALTHPKHILHTVSAPDSGYASAEEDEDGEPEDTSDDGDDEGFDIDVLRSDPFEREFVIRWLTTFAARSDTWVYEPDTPEGEQLRTQLVDDAASLLASFAGKEDEEDALTRSFSFPIFDKHGRETGDIKVELNDAPLLSQDHTSVGLQSWGSAIVFAERMCADQQAFGLAPAGHIRILELGAGTGLLSIAAAKLCKQTSTAAEVVATDYHAQVLDNLRSNVDTNLDSSSPITVVSLDWQNPVYNAPLHEPFDIILAADVIYHPEHAQWIKSCVEMLLRRPARRSDYIRTSQEGGTFWLIIPVRSTGRHEGMAGTVETVFRSEAAIKASGGNKMELGIRRMEGMGKHSGIGRADESCYRLFSIGWLEP
ncbi:putative methyltransferase-domain-containing protein [Cytidiella melzeri]|nr:putative methyltransferase-domain-containing protein [Cytidiella melzeri]